MGGQEFGNLAKAKNIITYSLSPFEQRAFAGMGQGFKNWMRRTQINLMYYAPGFISLALIYNYAKKTNMALKRKNPKDYENDV